MPRLEFGLGFSLNPPAADIIREDQFAPFLDGNGNESPLAKGQERMFKWVMNPYVKDKKKMKSEMILVKVLAIGSKTKLKELKVNSGGELIPAQSTEQPVGTRAQEISKQKYVEAHLQDDVLQELAEDFVQNGADAVCSRQVPRRNNLPTKRSTQELAHLTVMLDTMPCFSGGPGKTEILANRGVWGNTTTLALLRQELTLKPEDHFQKLMRHLLQPVKGVPGITARGKRGCVGVPENLVGTVLLYVLSLYVEKGGERKDVTFDAYEKVGNLLDNWRKKTSTATTTATTTTTTTIATHTTARATHTTATATHTTPTATITTAIHTTLPTTTLPATPNTNIQTTPPHSTPSTSSDHAHYSRTPRNDPASPPIHSPFHLTDLSTNFVNQVDIPFNSY